MLLILFLIFISVDSERDACLKRNSASMTCVSSSNSTSLGRECDINVAVGSDQVNTFLNLKNSIDYIQTKAGSDFVQDCLDCLIYWKHLAVDQFESETMPSLSRLSESHCMKQLTCTMLPSQNSYMK